MVGYAAVQTAYGDDVTVLAVSESREQLRFVSREILPIWYREGSRTPSVGERLSTWVDVSTRYVMAPRSSAPTS